MGSRLMCFHFGAGEESISQRTLVRGSIKFDISRRANDNRDPHSPRVRYAPVFALLFSHDLSAETSVILMQALIYREAKALIKIIPSLMFREEIASDHLSDAHQRKQIYCLRAVCNLSALLLRYIRNERVFIQINKSIKCLQP
jgi:hypothetical protein